jgi:hypothetical protein
MINSTSLVLLFGGIGNRLFQIARAWDIKQKGRSPQVIDIEEFPDLLWLVNKGLGWVQHDIWIDTTAICELMGLDRAQPSFSNRLKLYRAFAELLRSDRKSQFNIPLDEDCRSVQIGYFQAGECVTKQSTLAVIGALYETLVLESAPRSTAVVHIRGGDFALADRLTQVTIVEFIKAYPDAICVTNDVKYVSAEYPQLNISRSGSAKEDFITLAGAKHILPSNSTFCFWACAIALLRNGAELWSAPADEYWKLIAEQ